MSANKTTVFSNDITSTEDSVPTFVGIQFDAGFLTKAADCIAFMANTGASKVVLPGAFQHSFYLDTSMVPESHLDNHDVVVIRSKTCVAFSPEYALDDGEAVISANGTISAHFELEHAAGYLDCTIGTIEQLKQQSSRAN